LARPEDALTYELHVRDFSIGDETVPAAHRGTFLAFTDRTSDGMKHLRSIARAGAGFVQVLPAFDFATVPERRADQQVPSCDLASFPPDSDQQQACVEPVRPTDGFNWGYDPWHYTTPEGSYALDQSGAGRTKEFRSMVAGINRCSDVRASHGDDDLSLGVSLSQVPESVCDLVQLETPVYDSCHFPGREKLLQDDHVGLVELRDEERGLLAATHGRQAYLDDVTQRSHQTVALRRADDDEGRLRVEYAPAR
jgi:hypothetical protein